MGDHGMRAQLPPLSVTTSILRIGAPALVLGLYGLVLFVAPHLARPRGAEAVSRPILSAEQSRDLSDLCETLLVQRKYSQALEPSLKLYQAYPENHVHSQRLATIYNGLGRYNLEAQFWERFRENAPRPVDACPNIGRAYENQDKVKEAIAAYDWCLGFEPTNADFIFYLARAVERDSQLDRAAEIYQKGLTVVPANTDLRIGLTRTLVHKGELARARALIAPLVKEAPDNTDAMLAFGLLCMREGDLVKAREYFERGVALSRNYTDLHILLGQLSERENKPAEALHHYERALELSPANQVALARRSALRELR
jgi:tetratricopeptide (TPR) repeat protein